MGPGQCGQEMCSLLPRTFWLRESPGSDVGAASSIASLPCLEVALERAAQGLASRPARKGHGLSEGLRGPSAGQLPAVCRGRGSELTPRSQRDHGDPVSSLFCVHLF